MVADGSVVIAASTALFCSAITCCGKPRKMRSTSPYLRPAFFSASFSVEVEALPVALPAIFMPFRSFSDL